MATGSSRKEKWISKAALVANRMASAQLGKMLKWSESMRTWAPLRQEFPVTWNTSGMLRIVVPDVSVTFLSSPACNAVASKQCSSDGHTRISRKEWDRVIAWATQLVYANTEHQQMNRSDVVRVCRLKSCFIRFAALPRKWHMQCSKRPWLQADHTNASGCL
jgi:hypothetical protein